MAGSKLFLSASMYLPIKISFAAPLHAAPNLHCEYVKFKLGHLDHPNKAWMPSLPMAPMHDPPSGQLTQPARDVSALSGNLSGTHYSSSPQFSGWMPPGSLQND
jgi:hypothetical protein